MKFDDIKLPSNKKFGYLFSAIFLIAATFFLYLNNKSIGYIFIILALLFLITTIINANLLFPLNKLWMSFGLLLGKIISPIVLGVIFFVLFTTYAVIMRIMGRDELHLKHVKKQSYWRLRSDSSCQTNFKQQF